jgi:hypothetical protein
MAGAGACVFSAEEIEQHNTGSDGSFWAVVDGFVVDATEFVTSHPGGLRKLMSANTPGAGFTGGPFGFSFTRGSNSHFPATGRRFRDGVERFLGGGGGGGGGPDGCLPSENVEFPSYGKIVILGRLA